MEAELNVFCELVTVTLEGIYTSEEESAGLPSVDLELVSTGPSMESAADALGRLGRSAASLLRPGGFNRGPGSVFEDVTTTYTATVTWSDSSSSQVYPGWTLNAPFAPQAGMGNAGTLPGFSVNADQSATVQASFTANGVTVTANKVVSVLDDFVHEAVKVSC